MHSPSAAAARLLRTFFGGDSSAAAAGLNLRSQVSSAIRSAAAPVSDSATELLGGDAARLTRGLNARRPFTAMGGVLGGVSSALGGALGGARGRIASFDRPERLVPLAVCGMLVGAALLSSIPAVAPASAAGAPSRAPRVVLANLGGGQGTTSATDAAGASGLAARLYGGDGALSNTLSDANFPSGERDLITIYTVKNGDSVYAIARSFGLAATTVYWANKAQLPFPASIRAGQKFVIPAFDGLVIAVGAGDTVESLAAKYEVAAADIMDSNKLADTSLLLGQKLVIPGVSGGPMPVTAGGMRWPVVGDSSISQYFHTGHPALDIAAPTGEAVVAATGGTVIYAGWKLSGAGVGGGIVVWISHGSGIYTTYNHLSRETVRVGQRVRAGQRIGSVGATGNATGPHLHFEVWVCYPWTGWTTSCARNPLKYVG